MVILKKLKFNYRVKASTLMETLVASIIIIIVFLIASMILNNVFSNTIKNNTRSIDAYFNQLEYNYYTNKIILPYQDDFKHWNITINKPLENKNVVLLEAYNEETKKNVTKEIIED